MATAETAPSALKLSLLTIPAILGMGFLMGQLSNSGFGNSWFDTLRKPTLMPPGWLFGAAWSFLYILLGVAIALIISSPKSSARSAAIVLFSLQLTLNFAWSPIFFGLHEARMALLVILAMLGLSIATTAMFAKSRPLSAWLMAPYLAWLSFASFLNYEIIRLNPAA